MEHSVYNHKDNKWHHGKKWMPAMYVAYFGIIQQLANKHGYALCIHGSVVRDFDLVFIPFDPEVSPHEDVIKDIQRVIGADDSQLPEFNQHAVDCHLRYCYAVECGGGGYFDISFTPTMQQFIDEQQKQEQRRKEIDGFINNFPDYKSNE